MSFYQKITQSVKSHLEKSAREVSDVNKSRDSAESLNSDKSIFDLSGEEIFALEPADLEEIFIKMSKCDVTKWVCFQLFPWLNVQSTELKKQDVLIKQLQTTQSSAEVEAREATERHRRELEISVSTSNAKAQGAIEGKTKMCE